ncbi:MAG: hypothetical protein ACOC4C_04335 [Fibrobacterota bacterium]
MSHKNLFLSLLLGLSLTLNAADSEKKPAVEETKTKKDSVQTYTSDSRPSMKKTSRIDTDKTNWTKIKDLFM